MYRRNVAGQFLGFAAIDATTGATMGGVTGFAAYRVIDGGAQAAAGGTVADKGNGQYSFALSQADTNGNDVSILFTMTGMVAVEKTFVTTAADPTLSSFGLSLAKTTNVTGFNDLAATAIVTGGAIVTNAGAVSNVTNVANAPTSGDLTTAMKASVTAAVPTAASIATQVEQQIMDEADTRAVLAAIVAKINATDTDLSGLSVAAIAAASSASVWAAGSRTVTGGTVATLTSLPAAPTDWITAVSLSSAAVTKVQSGLAPASTALSTATWTNTRAGFLDASISSVSTGGVSAGDIAAAVAAQVTTDHGSGSYVRNTEPPTASAIAAAVRDVDNASPATGSLGAAINAGCTLAAADPLAVAVPGSYSAGTLGYLIGQGLKDVEAGVTFHAAMQYVAAYVAGKIDEAGDHTTTAIAAVGNSGVPRLSSVNTPTTRVVTVH